MGLPLRDLVRPEQVAWDALAGKTLAVDGHNALYQFLATIRQATGEPFTDEKGRVTSHLIGMLYRTTSVLAQGVRPVWIFDGAPPELKAGTLSARFRAKERAQQEWQEALATGDLATAKRKAAMTSRLTRPMVEEAKELLSALGVPAIQAPSEGEAQAAYLAAQGRVWAAASQDYDCLLFRTPRLVRGLAARSPRGQTPAAEVIDREGLLRQLGISDDELLLIGLLVGTDYNAGATGIGPKRALKLAQQHLGWEETLRRGGLDPEALEPVAELFRNPKVEDLSLPPFRPVDERSVERILVEEHGFSSDRVSSAVRRLRARASTPVPAAAAPGRQTTLSEAFGDESA
jgi:flap endonuclease-1